MHAIIFKMSDFNFIKANNLDWSNELLDFLQASQLLLLTFQQREVATVFQNTRKRLLLRCGSEVDIKALSSDLRKEFIEINVSFHCSNGGLRIDENGQTTIPGLYAVGENAAGPHGADRLGGAMMTLSQVFGAIAGKHAAESAREMEGPLSVESELVSHHLTRIDNLKKSQGQRKPQELMSTLKKSAWDNLLVVRSHESLTRFLEELRDIGDERQHLAVGNTADLVNALELNSLLQMGEIIARTSLMRTESRGSHYRDDFPERDDAKWLKSIVVRKMAGEMKLDTVVLDEEWQDEPDGFEGLWWG